MSGLVKLEGNSAAYHTCLRSLLDPRNLPVSLPLRDKATESIYGAFLHFTIDPDIVEKTGDEVGAFSEQMKAIFGWKTCSTGDGIIPIKEHGQALSAAVDVLSQFHKDHLNNAVVQKRYSISPAGTRLWCKPLLSCNMLSDAPQLEGVEALKPT